MEEKKLWILLFCLIGFFGFVFYMIRLQNEEIKACFMQEPRTKECEYILYRYENRSKHTTTVVPMPVVVR